MTAPRQGALEVPGKTWEQRKSARQQESHARSHGSPPAERNTAESSCSVIFKTGYERATNVWTRRAPTITGTAFVNAETTLLLGENDPFCSGMR